MDPSDSIIGLSTHSHCYFTPHTPHRVVFTPSPKTVVPGMVARRDALHFSDLRRGPTVVDSVVGHSGDDFFNVHNTLLLVLNCTSPTSCVVIEPHVTCGGPDINRPLYGCNSVMSTVRSGDHLSFFAWPEADMVATQLGSANGAGISSATPVADPTIW